MENTRTLPVPGEFYRHFKNRMYQIIAIAYHSETEEAMVVYQALYGEKKIWVRPLDMFMEEVDHGKYPDVEQKYRFEKVEADTVEEATAEEKPMAETNLYGKTADYIKEIVKSLGISECTITEKSN